MKVWSWLVLILLIGTLVGCSHPEATIPTALIVNGKVIPAAARLHGSGYSIPVTTLTRELDGTTEVLDEATILITLNGKTFLLGSGRNGLSFDHQIQGPVQWLGGEVQLYQTQLVAVIRLAYPGGKVYREGETIYILT